MALKSERSKQAKLIRQHLHWIVSQYIKDVKEHESLDTMSMESDELVEKRQQDFATWLSHYLNKDTTAR